MTTLEPPQTVHFTKMELLEHFASLPGGALHTEGDVRWFTLALPYDTFNGVIHAEFDPRTADDRIRWTCDQLRASGAEALWWTGPMTTPTDLPTRLTRAGLVPVETEPGMILDLGTVQEGAPKTDLVIRPVGTLQELRAWIALRWLDTGADVRRSLEALYEAATRDPARRTHYLGWRGEQPLVCGALFHGTHAAAVEDIVTGPDARGLGYGTAMTAELVRLARAAGHRHATLTASPQGEGIYRRLGFRTVGEISAYFLASGGRE